MRQKSREKGDETHIVGRREMTPKMSREKEKSE